MTDPRIPPDLLGHQAASASASNAAAKSGDGSSPSMASQVDPLGWCVIATTALLTWLLGPIVLTVFAAIGFVKYWRAWRSGASDSQCILGDIRIVLVYLGLLTVGGLAATIVSFT